MEEALSFSPFAFSLFSTAAVANKRASLAPSLISLQQFPPSSLFRIYWGKRNRPGYVGHVHTRPSSFSHLTFDLTRQEGEKKSEVGSEGGLLALLSLSYLGVGEGEEEEE